MEQANPIRLVLIGIHDATLATTVSSLISRRGVAVDQAPTVEEMLECLATSTYDLIYMDANLGSRGSTNISSARSVYGVVKEKMPQALFYAVSGNPQAVDLAKDAGIPCYDKMDITPIKLLEQIK